MSNADQSDARPVNQLLPQPLPADPLPIFEAWFNQAHTLAVQPNPNAMSLATVDADAAPSVRIVLCKQYNLSLGYFVFYTNYSGRKGTELHHAPRAAACFHWDALDRQVRIEGPVTPSPAAESDAYFASRPAVSRVSAWASNQSQPIASRDALLAQLRATESRLGIDLDRYDRDPSAQNPVIPRPPHWGGFRLWAQRVELWVGGVGRLHDRAAWTRSLAPQTVDGVPGFSAASQWASTRLQP